MFDIPTEAWPILILAAGRIFLGLVERSERRADEERAANQAAWRHATNRSRTIANREKVLEEDPQDVFVRSLSGMYVAGHLDVVDLEVLLEGVLWFDWRPEHRSISALRRAAVDPPWRLKVHFGEDGDYPPLPPREEEGMGTVGE